MEALIVYVTVGSIEEADKISHALVEEKRVACVNRLSQIQSTYFWEGKVCQDPEFLLMMKTQKACMPALIKRIKELHSYDVPEIIATPIVDGSKDYIDWIYKEATTVK